MFGIFKRLKKLEKKIKEIGSLLNYIESQSEGYEHGCYRSDRDACVDFPDGSRRYLERIKARKIPARTDVVSIGPVTKSKKTSK